jgi:hypothetical protein
MCDGWNRRACLPLAVIRFFRAAEYMNEFLKSLSVKDDVERYLSLFKAFWLTVWMGCDHLQWLQKVGYIKLADLKVIDEYHSKGWFFGLAAGLLIAAYKLKLAVDENKVSRRVTRRRVRIRGEQQDGPSAADR